MSESAWVIDGLGQVVRDWRQGMRLSACDCASLVGVSESTLVDVEALDEATPRDVEAIASAMGIPADELMALARDR